MTATMSADRRRDTRMRPRRRDWPGAFSALQKLLSDKEDTSQVFAILYALNGNAYARDYARLLDTPLGGTIAYERVELAERLSDETWRASFPAGSVGAAYVQFLETEHLSPQGLVDESHKGVPPAELDQHHPHFWFFRRVRDLHDIIHVLTGYSRDALGELCMLSFSYQETHNVGGALIAAGGFMRAHGPEAGRARKAILEARRRGRTAAWLIGEDYERVMLEPLEDARRRLGLNPPVAYNAVPAELRNLTLA